MSTLRENPEKRVFRIGILVIALGSVPIFPFFGFRAGGSFLAGGALSAVSLLWLRYSVGSLTLANAKHSKQRILAGFLLWFPVPVTRNMWLHAVLLALYSLAVFLGALPYFWVLALVGKEVAIPGWVLIAAAAVIAAGFVVDRLRRPRESP